MNNVIDKPWVARVRVGQKIIVESRHETPWNAQDMLTKYKENYKGFSIVSIDYEPESNPEVQK